MDKKLAKDTLKRFCSFPIGSSKEILDTFAELPNARCSYDENGKGNFVYIPGTREDRVLLIAHADTVWDKSYNSYAYEQALFEQDGKLFGENEECGIGADDRAGCAILWLLRNSGHSLLVTDGEEIGCVASRHIRDTYPELYDELNNHCYMIQFDRRESENYKVYNLPVTDEFVHFIEDNTGYYDSGKNSGTDIVVLARDICAVNLCVGYYKEHTPFESIVVDEWLQTLCLAEKILSGEQRKFPLAN